MSRRKKDTRTMLGVLAALTGVVLVSWWQAVTASGPATEAAELASTMTLASATPVKGAPLLGSATATAAPVDASTSGSLLGANSSSLASPRVLSQDAIDLAQRFDAATPSPVGLEKTADGRWTKLPFSVLAGFKYEMPDASALRKSNAPKTLLKDQVPQRLKELNGSPCLVVGFMVPMEMERDGRVKRFALTLNQQYCCYGVPPAMNEWVMVEMEDGYGADFYNDVPVAAYGLLSVGEELDNGFVTSLYRMTSNEVISAHELLRRAKGG